MLGIGCAISYSECYCEERSDVAISLIHLKRLPRLFRVRNDEDWRKVSSLWFVKNVTTPTLLLHGARDVVSTPNQAMMFFHALKEIGKAPVRYIDFPREPHEFREPRHQRRRDIEEIRWMQKYIRGIDWKPWERKEQK